MGNGGTNLEFELYKLEYETAATRYQNIYSAVWQNFSFVSALSVGLLAFGGDRLQDHLLLFLATAPLVFWYWATFLPLNHYGDRCYKRLGDIEGLLNKLYS